MCNLFQFKYIDLILQQRTFWIAVRPLHLVLSSESIFPLVWVENKSYLWSPHTHQVNNFPLRSLFQVSKSLVSWLPTCWSYPSIFHSCCILRSLTHPVLSLDYPFLSFEGLHDSLSNNRVSKEKLEVSMLHRVQNIQNLKFYENTATICKYLSFSSILIILGFSCSFYIYKHFTLPPSLAFAFFLLLWM